VTPRQRSRIYDRDEGLCQVCGGPAEEVDHVIPRSALPGKRLRAQRDADSNLICICHACHHQKHHGGRVR
jgi:5-methylcytosine-specific restriction endonuclease McrA